MPGSGDAPEIDGNDGKRSKRANARTEDLNSQGAAREGAEMDVALRRHGRNWDGDFSIDEISISAYGSHPKP